MKKITPKMAIRLNCRFCQGGVQVLPECQNHCSINGQGSILSRIKNNCKECAADHKPEECNGQLIGTQREILAEVMGVTLEQAICPLHPFRFGKNPNLRRELSEAERKQVAERGRGYRFQKKEAFSA